MMHMRQFVIKIVLYIIIKGCGEEVVEEIKRKSKGRWC